MTKLPVLRLVGGLCGLIVGSGVGISCGPCPTFTVGNPVIAVIVVVGLVVWALFMVRRPDPRRYNRQDPPMPPDE